MNSESSKSEWSIQPQARKRRTWPDILIKIILLLSLAVTTVVAQTAYSYIRDIRATYQESYRINILEPLAQACVKAQGVVNKNPWKILRKDVIENRVITYILLSKNETFSITVSTDDRRFNKLTKDQMINFSIINSESHEFQRHITPR